jgi:hypothetical protein
MKTSTKIISATFAAVSLVVAGGAFAHQGQGMGPCMAAGQGLGMGHGMGMGMGMGPGMGQGMGMGPGMGMRHGMQGLDTTAAASTRLASLKAELKITAVQEPAWQKYQTLVLQQAEAEQAMRSAMQAQMQDPKAAVEFDFAARRESMGKLCEAHQAERAAARDELFAVMTPEQKALALQRLNVGYGRYMSMRSTAR